MLLVKPYARIMEPELLAGALSRIEYAARVSHRSEENASDSPEKFIRAVVLQHGDWSVTEHVSCSVRGHRSRVTSDRQYLKGAIIEQSAH